MTSKKEKINHHVSFYSKIKQFSNENIDHVHTDTH